MDRALLVLVNSMLVAINLALASYWFLRIQEGNAHILFYVALAVPAVTAIAIAFFTVQALSQ